MHGTVEDLLAEDDYDDYYGDEELAAASDGDGGEQGDKGAGTSEVRGMEASSAMQLVGVPAMQRCGGVPALHG